ncbi:hypothetical protein N658DRAFT_495599 [Parathielavia hyrcaniae]|uniref:Uncharacterized protein n=1 Tax=Parathielavia hyrcaniae TaxID=113614 RepID=A0AAN6T222_9PEZI|nr:hypothetical protein N658DRAFT_495599 [Parathielavia hyrcaniae]
MVITVYVSGSWGLISTTSSAWLSRLGGGSLRQASGQPELFRLMSWRYPALQSAEKGADAAGWPRSNREQAGAQPGSSVDGLGICVQHPDETE